MEDSKSAPNQPNNNVEPKVAKRKSWLKIVTTTVLTLLAVGIVAYKYTPFFEFSRNVIRITTTSESHEERYRDIDRLLEEIEYLSAGRVIEEHYDGGTNPMDPAHFKVTIEGEDSFQFLKDKILQLSRECGVSGKAVSCVMKTPSIDLFQRSKDTTILVLND